MGSGFSKMKKQAKLLEKQFSEAQEQLKSSKYDGEAGGGLVKITINGEKSIENLIINPECVDKDDVEGLQDLIIAAFENATQKIEENGSPLGSGGGFPFPF